MSAPREVEVHCIIEQRVASALFRRAGLSFVVETL